MPFDYKAGLHTTWFETDGRGSWASGTASGPNTRRQHGLLQVDNAAGHRRVLLHHLEEWLEIDGQRTPLSTTLYRDLGSPGRVSIQPQGYLNLASFQSCPYPRWVFIIQGHHLIRTVRPVRSEPGFLIEYALLSSMNTAGTDKNSSTAAAIGAARIVIRPMISGRASDALTLETSRDRAAVHAEDTLHAWQPDPDAPRIWLRLPHTARYQEDPHWYRSIRLVDSPHDEEALWSPGEVELPLVPDQPTWLKWGTGDAPPGPGIAGPSVILHEPRVPPAAAALLRRAITWDKLHPHVATFTVPPSTRSSGGEASLEESVYALLWLAECLELDALHGLARGVASRMHSDPDHPIPLDIRLAWILVLAEMARRGIRMPDESADALLFLDSLLNGELNSAYPMDNMLLRVVETQQSWWERHDDSAQPRTGFPVDIQALWINALAAGQILETVLGAAPLSSTVPPTPAPRSYGRLFLLAADSFRRLYWNASKSYLYDNLDVPVADRDQAFPGQSIPSLRITAAPILAQALRFELLSPSRGRAILETARRLLTVESHRRGSSGAAGFTRPAVVGFRAFADFRTAWPWLIAPWQFAWSRSAPTTSSPISTPGAVRWLTHAVQGTSGELVIPSTLEPLPPPTHAAGNEPIRFSRGEPGILALAALTAACHTLLVDHSSASDTTFPSRD